MITDYFGIKDKCRKGLINHLRKAFSKVHEIENPEIMDAGCGTGVQTLWIANKYSGNITAIDIDKNALDCLQNKIKNKNLLNRITIINNSFFDFKAKSDNFDIIIAEGLLNVIGFERGLLKMLEFLKINGYLIIHDEYKNHENKIKFIQNNNCQIINTIYLDEKVWWIDYYRQLESEISKIKNKHILDNFISDIIEIENYKINPSSFRSIYYIIKKLNKTMSRNIVF
jgi:ubiquinone/menaquinone biosynthesis C-methylase UbiE